MVNMSDKDLQVLIIEDEQLLNEAYARVLASANIALLRAYNGKEALDILKGEKPDIILLDLRMPVMDGIEFLKKLQPKENLPDAKIIVFSNYDDQHEIDEAFALGAMHYMLKAWATPDELVKLIREVDNASQPVASKVLSLNCTRVHTPSFVRSRARENYYRFSGPKVTEYLQLPHLYCR
jgi:two-component system response regulator (stage 0 sporulation protein F)